MTQTAPKPITSLRYPRRHAAKGSRFLGMIRTTDPKDIAILYLVTSFGFFMAGGAMAMLIRAELARPGLQFLSNEQYNQLFTMHGTIMLLLYATPILFGFANYIVPLQIGAPDVAFPRLNAFSYWLFLFGGLIVLSGFVTPGGAADFGWFAYTPLSDAITLTRPGWRPVGHGPDPGRAGHHPRGGQLPHHHDLPAGPGHDHVPDADLLLGILVTAILILTAFPILTAALFGLRWTAISARTCSTRPTAGSSSGSTCSGSSATPRSTSSRCRSSASSPKSIPVFSRKPLFGYKGMVFANIAIAALSVAVWAHHMYATGAVLLAFFSFTTFLIAVPTGIKFVNWIGTMWRGQLTFETPMLFALGFLATFLFGGLTGVLLASPPLDFNVSDTYFVVAHFHYVLFGTIVFATYAGIYFWFPKMTGRMMDETLGKFHFWTTFFGFH